MTDRDPITITFAEDLGRKTRLAGLPRSASPYHLDGSAQDIAFQRAWSRTDRELLDAAIARQHFEPPADWDLRGARLIGGEP